MGVGSGEQNTALVLWPSSAEMNQAFHVMAAAE